MPSAISTLAVLSFCCHFLNDFCVLLVRAQTLEDKNEELKNYAANIKNKELEVKDLFSLH